MADIVGFGVDGVSIIRNTSLVKTDKVLDDFGYDAGGWRVEKHVRLVADTTGDGTADFVGFGNGGVLISTNNGNNTWNPVKLAIADFAYDAGGWRVEKHVRYVADLRKTGRADIVGFGDAGVLVSLNNGGGNFSSASLATANFGYDQGWRMDKHLRFLADVTGNGLPDIVGFGENYVYTSANNGDGTFQPAKSVINNFTYSAGGWRIDKHPRTVADLTGNGRADIIGFGEGGVYISLNNDDGTFQSPKLVVTNFGYAAGGWRVDMHPRFVVDVTGDGRADIVGFGNAGVYVSKNNGDGTFSAPQLVVPDFGYYAGGWRVDKHLRFVVDLTGNGAADIIGFGESGVLVSYNDGKGNFGPVTTITSDFGYNGGQWSLDKTVRWVANLY